MKDSPMKRYLKKHVDETNPHKFWKLTNTLNGTKKQSTIDNLARLHCDGSIPDLVEKINAFLAQSAVIFPPLVSPYLTRSWLYLLGT
jgi:hypothetical protein